MPSPWRSGDRDQRPQPPPHAPPPIAASRSVWPSPDRAREKQPTAFASARRPEPRAPRREILSPSPSRCSSGSTQRPRRARDSRFVSDKRGSDSGRQVRTETLRNLPGLPMRRDGESQCKSQLLPKACTAVRFFDSVGCSGSALLHEAGRSPVSSKTATRLAMRSASEIGRADAAINLDVPLWCPGRPAQVDS